MIRAGIFLALMAFSCKPYTGVYSEGRYQRVTHSKKYPALLFPMKIAGTHLLVDTVTGRVMERTRFRQGIGLFGRAVDYKRTVRYDEKGNRTSTETVRRGRRTGVEYARDEAGRG